MPKPFNGSIELDIRDSVPDRAPYLADKAPEDAHNAYVDREKHLEAAIARD